MSNLSEPPLPTGPSEPPAADDGRRRRQIVSWSLWDFGSNAYNTVILSFVFSVYLTTGVAANEERGQQVFADMQTAAGVLVALLAPAVGAWADRVKNRRLMLAVTTMFVIICVAALWFVRPEDSFLYLGAALIAAAGVFQEIANVFYYAMLNLISTKDNIGRISGTAWALGYLGGVICLVVALFGFVQNGLGLPTDDAVNYRGIALFCALWLLVMSLPVFFWGPNATDAKPGKLNPITAYREVFGEIVDMWRQRRSTLHFLVASAVYRDGLGAVFAFAGVIAANAYGFSTEEVIVFGLVANAIAAFGTWALGRADDRFGPKPVVMACLIAMVISGAIIIVANNALVFWIAGLFIASLVGAVQSASRTLLVRAAPDSEQNAIFGLYATVGRAVTFLSPALVALFTRIGGVRWGIMGIVVTLLLGLLLFWPLNIPGVTDRKAERAA
ncbi:MFS transporter [Enemella sp. A6]|uniref:MFS transporter n=1 Tax=Enemella sp. A6 TaxID=3440152 RepID=UPI003EB871C7